MIASRTAPPLPAMSVATPLRIVRDAAESVRFPEPRPALTTGDLSLGDPVQPRGEGPLLDELIYTARSDLAIIDHWREVGGEGQAKAIAGLREELEEVCEDLQYWHDWSEESARRLTQPRQ